MDERRVLSGLLQVSEAEIRVSVERTEGGSVAREL